jgi:hypothetical protein
VPDLRAFIAIDHHDKGTFYGPYDFGKAGEEDEHEEYYNEMDMCEGGSGMDVVELIKRPNGSWEHIGPHP